MNHVTLYGNLARDPSVREVQSGGKDTTVVNFTIATSRFFKKANGERSKDVTFVDCEAWDGGAKTIGEYFHKGDPILVEGALKNDTWEDDSGKKMSRMRVRVSHFRQLYRAPLREGTATNVDESSPKPEGSATIESAANVPF